MILLLTVTKKCEDMDREWGAPFSDMMSTPHFVKVDKLTKNVI